ncbi:MAG: hypothetical protein GY729_20990, partial [Desulfobacteraceae bacterium]|nr:hypothetical protein [Desulfobacteraceae bacterium]
MADRFEDGKIKTKIENLNGATTTYAYTYDSMNRLKTVHKNGAKVEDYSYDLSGAKTSVENTLRGISGASYGYDDESHLLTVGTTSYQYDLDGFLTTKTTTTGASTYTYSSRGELLNATLEDGTFVEYDHDPYRRRIAKNVNVTVTEKYLWKG